MAAFTSIVIGAVAAASVAGTVYSTNQRRKQARQAEKRMEKQETAAKEAAAVETTREDTGAKVKLGTEDTTTAQRRTARAGGTARSGTVANTVGGLGASTRLGL